MTAGRPAARSLAERALLYARTARHLRWRQWVYRPVRRLQPRAPGPAAPRCAWDEDAAARLRGEVRALLEAGGSEARLRRADEVCDGRFTFLNVTELLPSVDWRALPGGKLWRYNLQYFDYAPDLALAFVHTGERRYLARLEALAEGWMAAAETDGGEAWEPYPVSLRAVSWILALVLAGDAMTPSVVRAMQGSVARQLAFLARRLEWHILANHLQKNLHALAVGALVFRGPEADRWRDAARALWGELDEQVLEDGGHYERSPMYHAIALGDFLELAALLGAAGETVPPAAEARVRAMVRAHARLSRPDGSLHLFNDAADGIAPTRARLSALAARLLGEEMEDPEGAWALPATGYFGYANAATGERMIVDCGPPGPAYQPGHAHCDLLSFELSLGGVPVVVDSGVSGYDGDPLREYARSTRAHNTVSVDGREQSEVWGTFRLARRAEGIEATWSGDGDGFRFDGGYRPFHDRGVVHARRVERGAGRWRVEDRVTGADGRALASRLHLHPACVVERGDDGVRVRAGAVRAVVRPFGVDEWALHGAGDAGHGWYCPEFGRALAAPVLELRRAGDARAAFGYEIAWEGGAP